MTQTGGQTDSIKHIRCAGARLILAEARNQARHHHILKRAEIREEMVQLKNKANVTISYSHQF